MRMMSIDEISNDLSVAGTPIQSPVCLPMSVTRAAAMSPLATDGPIVALMSENALRNALTKKTTPSLPSG
jgi:hypothetical protein